MVAIKTLDGSVKVCVWFIEMQNKIKNKAFVNNYNSITCLQKKSNSTLLLVKWNHVSPFPSKQFDKFDKLVIQGSLKWMKEWNRVKEECMKEIEECLYIWYNKLPIYGNFDKVLYAFWEIGDLVYMKMLAYHSEENLIRKE